jgi:hypothetical protein
MKFQELATRNQRSRKPQEQRDESRRNPPVASLVWLRPAIVKAGRFSAASQRIWKMGCHPGIK